MRNQTAFRFRAEEERYCKLSEKSFFFLLLPGLTIVLESICRYCLVDGNHDQNRKDSAEHSECRFIRIQPTWNIITACAVTYGIAISQMVIWLRRDGFKHSTRELMWNERRKTHIFLKIGCTISFS